MWLCCININYYSAYNHFDIQKTHIVVNENVPLFKQSKMFTTNVLLLWSSWVLHFGVWWSIMVVIILRVTNINKLYPYLSVHNKRIETLFNIFYLILLLLKGNDRLTALFYCDQQVVLHERKISRCTSKFLYVEY